MPQVLRDKVNLAIAISSLMRIVGRLTPTGNPVGLFT
jgi:hypothetical protein